MMYNKETESGKKRTEELSYPNPNLLLNNFLLGEENINYFQPAGAGVPGPHLRLGLPASARSV
jgi:hypothetical protein